MPRNTRSRAYPFCHYLFYYYHVCSCAMRYCSWSQAAAAACRLINVKPQIMTPAMPDNIVLRRFSRSAHHRHHASRTNKCAHHTCAGAATLTLNDDNNNNDYNIAVDSFVSVPLYLRSVGGWASKKSNHTAAQQ